MRDTRSKRIVFGALAFALALALYLPAVRNGFIAYDDPLYVTENRHVLRGLTLEGLRWSLTATDGGSWHPLTWWSHMLAVDLFGTWAGGHHLLNALLHAGAAAALFGALSGLTGALAPSLAVAGLFAVHPLHVESVAWVAERKDVLVALLLLLALSAWAAYLRRPGPLRYCAALGLFALGLAAKPLAVVLPPLLLVLDLWPLGRLRPGPGRRLGRIVAEKVPFFAAAAAVAALSVSAQHDAGALWRLAEVPPDFRATLATLRVSNAAVSYAAYLGAALWPAGLAVFHPHPAHTLPASSIALAALLLSGITAAAVLLRRRAPWVASGWAWYLVALAPVIGVVQAGAQGRADRYAYLPLIGLWLALAWSVRALLSRRPGLRPAAAAAAIASLAALAVLSTSYLGRWRDTETLFTHALAVTRDNYLAHRVLGEEARRRGRPTDAERHFRESLRIAPLSSQTHNQLGLVLVGQGRVAEAADAWKEALRQNPGNAEARNNLALALAWAGDLSAAEEQLREAARLAPGLAEVWVNLGDALARRGRDDEAAEAYGRALAINPGLAALRMRLERSRPGGGVPR